MTIDYRIENDTMGAVRVPAAAFYGAQTMRAMENFPVSGIRFPGGFIHALGLIKLAAAQVNRQLGHLDPKLADAIIQAGQEVADGRWDAEFPIDIFQTGSGTSTNMNANEVIANRAIQILGGEFGSNLVHPNDHVNMSQSSNDAIPTAVHVAAYLEATGTLLPALLHLHETLHAKAVEFNDALKTGRTHLMDAMPVRLGQEFGGYAAQVKAGIKRIEACLPRLAELALGGTAVGTGINAPPGFAAGIARRLGEITGLPFREAENHFAAQSAMDSAVELSGQLKSVAVSLMKISNDLRWMNSGPVAGLDEIALPDLQPGSSMMPGKVNPVIPEAVTMVCAQVFGNDLTVTIAGQSGNFELNVMLPVLAYNLLQTITLLANASRILADKALEGTVANRSHMSSLMDKNPILATALSPVIGYDKAAQAVKKACAEGKTLREVVVELGYLSDEEAVRLLDARPMTGI